MQRSIATHRTNPCDRRARCRSRCRYVRRVSAARRLRQRQDLRLYRGDSARVGAWRPGDRARSRNRADAANGTPVLRTPLVHASPSCTRVFPNVSATTVGRPRPAARSTWWSVRAVQCLHRCQNCGSSSSTKPTSAPTNRTRRRATTRSPLRANACGHAAASSSSAARRRRWKHTLRP